MSPNLDDADPSAEDVNHSGPISRRRAIGLGGAAILGASLATDLGAELARPGRVAATAGATPSAALAVVDALRPEIQPRSAWGADLPVTGEIVAEEDVRFLLVHHTASTNSYGPDDVISQIRDFHGLHTGPEKAWPDVAYNFFVDRFGTIWEARSGSVDGAVRGDATGGSQGHAMLCSLIGNHAEAEITPEATDSLVHLLAWLAERHDVDTTPGATVDFVSRGSNKWAEGAVVTAATISGHRDMSETVCPGDFAYNLLPEVLPLSVSARREEVRAATAKTATSTTAAPQASVVEPPETDVTQATSPTTEVLNSEQVLDANGTAELHDDGPLSRPTILAGAAATAVAVIAGGVARLRRRIPGSE